jgi:hypothetical protein
VKPGAGVPQNQQKVLYIGGFGRSGSTLVERILGQLPGFCSAGEIVFLWQRGLLDGQLCGCGVPVPQCEFWSRVGKTAFGGWDQIDAAEMLGLQKRADRNRFIPAMVTPAVRPGARSDVARYGDVLSRLYRAIGEVSGARVVIDASKHASTAFFLTTRVPGLDVRVVHLVRDPRGVAYSWTKEVKKPEVTGEDAFMPVYSPVSSGRQWLSYNLLFEGLRALPAAKSAVFRYEDMLADPRAELERILAHAGEPVLPESFAFLGERPGASGASPEMSVTLGVDHTVAGNPMRFHQGPLALRLDEAWKSKLPERDQRIVAAVTTPLRLRYGYTKRNSTHG